MFFQYGVMGMLAVSFYVPKKRNTSNFYLGLMFGYALLNTVLFRFTPDNRMILNNLFMGFVVIKLLSERLSFDFKMVGNLLAIFCMVNVLWIVLQMNHIDPVFKSSMPQNMPQVDLVGLMALKSNLGILAVLSFPFIVIASPLSSIICLPLLWFGESSTCVAAFGLTLLFMLWCKNKKLFFVALVFVLAAAVYYILKIDMPTGQFSKRFNVWFAGINYLAGSSPWFGAGIGSWAMTRFTTMQENGQPQTWVWAHNEFLQYLFELGFFGAVTLYAYFKNLICKINLDFPNHRKAVTFLIPIICVSFFHFPWHLGRFAGLLCFMIACIEALLSKKSFEEILYAKD